MRQWRADGFEIILSGDLNEVLGDDPNEFAAVTTEFNLTDIYRHRHGLDEPATHQRGHKRLDYILCTSALLPAVTARPRIGISQHVLQSHDGSGPLRRNLFQHRRRDRPRQHVLPPCMGLDCL
jgi:hypothetical protein